MRHKLAKPCLVAGARPVFPTYGNTCLRMVIFVYQDSRCNLSFSFCCRIILQPVVTFLEAELSAFYGCARAQEKE